MYLGNNTCRIYLHTARRPTQKKEIDRMMVLGRPAYTVCPYTAHTMPTCLEKKGMLRSVQLLRYRKTKCISHEQQERTERFWFCRFNPKPNGRTVVQAIKNVPQPTAQSRFLLNQNGSRCHIRLSSTMAASFHTGVSNLQGRVFCSVCDNSSGWQLRFTGSSLLLPPFFCPLSLPSPLV